MPITPTYPGLYIEEIPSNSHTISAAPTSVAVFIGYTHPFQTQTFNQPVQIFSFADYERLFGGFFTSSWFEADENAGLFSDVAMAVYQFFQNGGAVAYVVGLQSSLAFPIRGSIAGDWPSGSTFYQNQESVTCGNVIFAALVVVDNEYQLTITIDNIVNAQSSPPGNLIADLTITYGPTSAAPAGAKPRTETYSRVNFAPDPPSGPANPNSIVSQINGTSQLVSVAFTTDSPLSDAPQTVEDFESSTTSPPSPSPNAPSVRVSFGSGLGAPHLIPPSTGNIYESGDFTQVMQADSPLDKLAIFNLLVIPGVTDPTVLSSASSFCVTKRAFFIMDPAINETPDGAVYASVKTTQISLVSTSKNSALYFPYLQSNNPITGAAISIPPSGTVAGIFAAIDQNRGVWKAPAGLETLLTNVTDVVPNGRMTDQRQGVLNQAGINCIRNFPGIGPVVFGARTSVSANPSFQDWKYVPVRRMALFLEQTLYANLGWVVFEPNADPLWTAIRSSIESFMLGLFKQGAFQGNTPSDAFQVKCDNQTTTQDDINNGIVNIVVAFAPLKPAEFVIIQIAQLAGQTQTS